MRKLAPEEIVEVLEGPRCSEIGEAKVARVRARALEDNVEGWVTVSGDQGEPFLEDVAKPCLFATDALSLQDGFSSKDAKMLRHLKPFEVIEILQGPTKEDVGIATRAKGTAAADGSIGWFTIRSKHGITLAEPRQKLYTTNSAIALTDSFDISACKVLRKLTKGEVLTLLDGPQQDERAGVTRIKILADKDSKEGWVTVTGNGGSKYAEETGCLYCMSKQTPLQKGVSCDSESIRMLAEQEALIISESPVEERSEALFRLRGRCVSDGSIGWVSFTGSRLKPWSPRYRCLHSTTISDALEIGIAENLRRLEIGEIIEVVEGPSIEPELGIMRVKGMADSDGETGWITLAGNQGTQFLEVVADGNGHWRF